MICSSVRVLIWLLALCVPAQASAAAWLRANGPAHAHVEALTAAASATRPGPQAVRSGNADYAAWHAHEHASSRAVHHDHEAADDSVILIPDPGNDEHGAGAAAGKVSVTDMPAVLPCARCSPIASPGCGLANTAAAAFDSVDTLPLYRPPR